MTVGPPPHSGEAHAFEFHGDCFEDWRAFVARARDLASSGGRETLRSYPLEHGVGELVDD